MTKIAKITAVLKNKKLDAILVTSLINIRYLTGFAGSSAMLLITDKKDAFLITDFRYKQQSREQAHDCEVVVLKESYLKEINLLVQQQGLSNVGFESRDMSFARYSELTEKLGLSLTPIDNSVENIRTVKEPYEIEKIKAACKITVEAMEFAARRLKERGISEKEIAMDIECFMRKKGAEDVAFKPIVGSGPNSSKPHAAITDRIIRQGDFVVIDIGAMFDGYCSDMTRTFCIGKTSNYQKEIYEIVRHAHKAVVASDLIGKSGKDVDLIARDIIDKTRYKGNFGHGLGHGVGLEEHEQPSLSPRSDNLIDNHMVFTVEPGIYVEEFGVRIEDTVSTSGGRLFILTDLTTELQEL